MIMINKFPLSLKNKINFITKFGNKSLRESRISLKKRKYIYL